MSDKLLIGNFPQGLRNDREPFAIDNDAFPTLQNAYVWRGKVLKKGGTELLGCLRRDLTAQALGNTDGAGALSVNLISLFSLEADASIVPGSISIAIGAQTFTDNSAGVLSNGGAGTGTINYATGAIVLQTAPVLVATAAVAAFSYYPRLPVMGLEDFETNQIDFPSLLSFDTKYSYQYNQSTEVFYSTSFYKSSLHPVTWTGQDYQQFWSCNYQGALWALNNNAYTPPFATVFSAANQVTATPTLVIYSGGAALTTLVNGDYIWINEGEGTSWTLNGQTGQVTDATGSATGTYVVTFATSQTINTYTASTAIVQLLTATRPGSTGDGIRWYDGDPSGASGKGWVNFAPPLSEFEATDNPNPLYLVGALAVLPYKNRLIFFAPTFSTSAGVSTYYQNRIVFSWNGTPYYSSLVPTGQTSVVSSWYFPPTGQAGFLGAGIDQQLVSVTNNEDVLLVGFENRQTRLVYTENDLTPFIFQSINSQMGSEGTFSGVTLDEGAISVGTYGIIQTSQYGVQRIDLQIPDEVFNISGANNGVERICSIRDYYNELIYFTYPLEGSNGGEDDNLNPNFPNQSLVYNYRDKTWAIFIENYTTYGTFRKTTALTWNDITWTWEQWTDPWAYGQSAPRFPQIIGGNQQGYVIIKKTQRQQAGEDVSGYFTGISTNVITSPNHNLQTGDYLYFSGAIGLTGLNATIRSVNVNTVDTFTIDGDAPTGTYLGGGEFIRLTNFEIQTKQFPAYWEQGRQVRLGNQRYLFNRTDSGQLTILISLSQDMTNSGSPTGMPGLINSGVIYNNLVYTSPDPDSITLPGQAQIWHNLQTSLIGDTVQIGMTLSDEQMRDIAIAQSPVTLQAIHIELYPAGVLAQ